jgi:serine/threonine-protein kinase
MLGRYEMLLPIAAGGMGNVWAARLKGTRGFRKLVAVKTVLHAVDDEKLEQMLFQEATLASQIHHPNVVETIELGEHDNTLYLVMELVFGESLSFILREAVARGGVPLPVAVNLIGQVCRGLQAAHDLTDAYGHRVGLVHRDISPSNVLVTYGGNVKIVDFGVATTAANAQPNGAEIKGKLSYLAPEQLRGEAVDARVDVYATGLLLYLMTVQKHPFRGTNENDTIARILSEQPVTPPSAIVEDYPEALESVLLKALEKQKNRRFHSASALLEALEAAMPAAFGPNGDRLTLEYLEELLKPRMEERRATLRMAEELSEQSSARDSALSLPAMVASHHPAPQRTPSRGNVFAAGALVLTLGVLAAVAPGLLHKRDAAPSATPAVAAAVTPDSLPRQKLAEPAEPAQATTSSASTRTSNVTAHSYAAPAARPTHRSARGEASERESGSSAPSELAPVDSGIVVASASASASASTALDSTAALEVGSGLAMIPGAEAAPRPTAQPAPLNPAPAAPGPEGPRRVSSKLGHSQLKVNPTADPYRARLPRAFDRAGQSFTTTVNICVNATGSVTGVNVLQSAEPGIDREVSRAVSRWRYRPLVEAGKAVPFCYVLKYEIESR